MSKPSPSTKRILPALGDPGSFMTQWPATPYQTEGSAVHLDGLLRWAHVDEILNDQALQAPAFRMVQDHKLIALDSLCRPVGATSLNLPGQIDPARVVGALGGGATLVLQGLNRFWPPLGDLCRRLSSEVGHPVFANAYLTPPSARGFDAHNDPYHAWLMQCEGSKTWRLWGPSADPNKDKATLEVTLREGDVLWIPRGWWHSGTSLDTASLHVTLTVWATKVEDIVSATVSALSSSTKLSQELPPNALADGQATAKVAEIVALIGRLLSSLDPEDVAGRVIGTRRHRFDPLPASAITSALGLAPLSDFHAHPEAILHWLPDVDGATICTADALVDVPTDAVKNCRQLLDGAEGSISAHQLGQLDQSLLRKLVSARLLCAASHEASAAGR